MDMVLNVTGGGRGLPRGGGARGTGNIVRLGEDGINFAVDNTSRMQHAFKHAKDLGFGNWNKQTASQWKGYVK